MQVKCKPVETREELHLANDLMVHEHAEQQPDAQRWLLANGGGYPGYLPEHTRIAVHDGTVVAALRLISDTICIGEARLRMGGVGWVTTAQHHRRKDVATRLIEDTITYMRQQNYHVSMLFGIPDYYQRFGYTTVLPEHSIAIDTTEAASFESPFTLRAAKPGDISVMQRMHTAHQVQVSCSILRTTAHLKNKWERWKGWHVLADEQGRVIACLHARPGGKKMLVTDVGVAQFGLCPAVLGGAGKLAEQEGLGTIVFYLPPPHPIARYLSQFRSTHSTEYSRDAGGMMRFVNIGETLESMIPEWENILGATPHTARRAECTVVVGEECYRIRNHHGAVDVSPQSGRNKVTFSETELLHVLTGYGYVGDLLNGKATLLAPDARNLLATLFPKRCTYVCPFDRF
jgi:predicted N-acetyltransferase YhbS